MDKETIIKLFTKINKCVSSLRTVYSENEGQNSVDFNGEKVRFTYEVLEI